MSNSVFVYAPGTGEPFECSKINARDLVTHAGWSYNPPGGAPEAPAPTGKTETPPPAATTPPPPPPAEPETETETVTEPATDADADTAPASEEAATEETPAKAAVTIEEVVAAPKSKRGASAE